MIRRIRINNFKTMLNFEFMPAGINLIIGRNNSGKTNLCSAMRFLGLSSEREQTLDAAIYTALGERWNITNFNVHDNDLIEFEVNCELKYDVEVISFNYRLVLHTRTSSSNEAQPLSIDEECLMASGGRFAQTILLENIRGRVRMLHEEGFVQGRSDSPYYVGLRVPTDSTMLSQLFELENNPRAILFRSFLRSWSYYNFSPDALRQPDVIVNKDYLSSNGANLSRVLFALHNEKPRIERQLIDTVRVLEPQLEYFSFSSAGSEHVHLFAEEKSGNRLSARSLSDGTLRFIGMVYVILMAANNANNSGFPPLTIIEEPENGLYAGYLKPLIEKIDITGLNGQFVFTSHSPYFIDLFDNNLEGIHIIKSGHPSSSLIKPDSQKVKVLLDQMSLGEMHFREMLA